jgi:heat-inducible transcriptional repressor
MAFEALNDREQEILKLLIEHYVTTAEPVGSRILAQKYSIGLSPATIRNTMQDLEELGLVEQPHTSAGRVPTDEGYRTFVDRLLELKPLSGKDAEALRRQIAAEGTTAVEDLLEKTTRVLASISQQLGVTLAPRFDQGILSHVDLIPVAHNKILLILTVKSGLARTLLVEVDVELKDSIIEHTAQLLNERLSGIKIGELHQNLKERVKDLGGADARLLKMFVDASDTLWGGDEPGALRLEGTINLVGKPEFRDHEKLTGVIQMLEERTSLVELLRQKGIGEGIVITIGKEINLSEAEPCAMVTSPYKAGRVSGTIGIIGPKRMNYGRLIALVETTAKLLSKQLKKMF